MIGFLRRLVSLAAVLLPAVAFAQQDAPAFDLLSKDDAQAMFSMTGDQWQENVRRRVAEGAASAMETPETGVAMVTRTAAGDMLVLRPFYINGTDKPDFIQVTVSYRGPRAALLTDSALDEAFDAAQRRMGPEYELGATVERTEDGLLVSLDIAER